MKRTVKRKLVPKLRVKVITRKRYKTVWVDKPVDRIVLNNIERVWDYKVQDDRDLYNLFSALRGPDNNNLFSLKRHFTGRVRSILFPGRTLPGLTNSEPFTLEMLIELANGYATLYEQNHLGFKRKLATGEHYISHLRDAVGSSRGNVLWGGLEDELNTFLARFYWPHELRSFVNELEVKLREQKQAAEQAKAVAAEAATTQSGGAADQGIDSAL